MTQKMPGPRRANAITVMDISIQACGALIVVISQNLWRPYKSVNSITILCKRTGWIEILSFRARRTKKLDFHINFKLMRCYTEDPICRRTWVDTNNSTIGRCSAIRLKDCSWFRKSGIKIAWSKVFLPILASIERRTKTKSFFDCSFPKRYH